MSRQMSRDTTPPLRESAHVLEDTYPPKRRREYSLDRRNDPVDKFDEFYAKQLKEPRYDRNRPI